MRVRGRGRKRERMVDRNEQNARRMCYAWILQM